MSFPTNIRQWLTPAQRAHRAAVRSDNQRRFAESARQANRDQLAATGRYVKQPKLFHDALGEDIADLDASFDRAEAEAEVRRVIERDGAIKISREE